MGVSVEPVVAVIRAGRDFQKFGDPYEFSCTAILRGNECELVGAAGKFTHSFIDDLRRELRKLGVEKVWWGRKKKSGDHNVRVEL